MALSPSAQEIGRQAVALHRAGRLAEAETLYRQLLAANPNDFEALQLLGVIAFQCGQAQAAVDLIRRAIDIAGAHAPATYWHNLGEAYRELRQGADALRAYQRAIALDPNMAASHKGAANVLLARGRASAAIEQYEVALRLRPDDGEACNSLAAALLECGRAAEAVATSKRAARLSPDRPMIGSDVLRGLLFLPQTSAAQIAEAHREWWKRYGAHKASQTREFSNLPDPQRRLRVGYVSPDFRQHSVAYFFLPLLATHDPAEIETFCYSDVKRPDEMTRRIRAAAHPWRDVLALDDAQLEQQIRADGIDVLVDLTGHTAANRLTLFARRPAPVQISYLGYPVSTGVETIDARISDAYVDPPDAAAIERDRIVRVSPCAWCYSPPADAPPVDLSFDLDRPVTFGSFNHLAKVSDACIKVWSAVLTATVTSLLVLKSTALADERVRDDIRRRFARHGVDPSRLELLGREESLIAHLARYGRIDIALDPFPYNGTTTTCEALWMGVPVVTLAGNLPHARVGVSLLNSVGLNDLIAGDEWAYVEIARTLAANVIRRRELRASLREKVSASPLMDASNLAREMEREMRALWTKWCATRT